MHTAPKCEVHQIRRECCGRIGRDGRKPRPGMWASLGAQQRSDVRTHGRHQDPLSRRSVKCESSIPLPYAWLGAACGGAGRRHVSQVGRSVKPSIKVGATVTWTLGAAAWLLGWSSCSQRWAASGQRCCNTRSESAHAAQYAAGDRHSACITPRPPREAGRKAMSRAWLCVCSSSGGLWRTTGQIPRGQLARPKRGIRAPKVACRHTRRPPS